MTLQRTAVDTRTRLERAEAVKAIDLLIRQDGGGDEFGSYGAERGRCARRSALRIDCDVFDHQSERNERTGKTRTSRTCAGAIRARLRADGLALERVPGKRPCRR